MWVNWFESSPIQSLHRHGLQCETEFAAAVCMCVCVCVAIFIGKNSWVKVQGKWPYILRTCTQVTNYICRSPILKEISCECHEVLHQPWSNVTLFWLMYGYLIRWSWFLKYHWYEVLMNSKSVRAVKFFSGCTLGFHCMMCLF